MHFRRPLAIFKSAQDSGQLHAIISSVEFLRGQLLDYNAAMYEQCPKCGHVRGPAEVGNTGICPACGLVFAKWAQRAAPVRTRRAEGRPPDEERLTLVDRLTYVEPHTDTMVFRGRVAVYAAFFIWGWYFILLDLRLIERDHQIAAAVDALGTILVLAALCWGGYILYCQYRNLPAK